MPLYDGIGVIAEKHAVVLDIGSAFSKVGYAGEASPRAIVRTPQLSHLKDNSPALHNALVTFVHKLYFENLLVNPKDRRVVIVESIIGDARIRDELVRVLFLHYEVLSVLLAPSHLMPLFDLGIQDGLILDVGFTEATLIPVFDNVPILKSWQAQPLASQAVHAALRDELMLRATAKIGSERVFKKLSEVNVKISDEVIEDIKVRFCFVTEFDRGQALQQIRSDASEVVALSSFLEKTAPAVTYPLDGNTLLQIDGQSRESACEVLFEQDNDFMSIPTMILDALLKSPIDTRRQLASNIVLIGGTTMIPGFKARLHQELKHLLETPRYKERVLVDEFRFHVPLSKPMYTAWAGASIFGSTDAVVLRSFTRENFLKYKSIPDWANLKFNSTYADARQG